MPTDAAHPDAAFSRSYLAPAGVAEEPCRHAPARMRLGPTSRRRGFLVPVDSCRKCGRILRSAADLDWRQYDWIRRINRRH